MAEGEIHYDGHSKTDQGDFFKQRSIGSSSIPREPFDTEIDWFAIRRASESHIEAIPRDLNGQPHRWCSGYALGGHYSPVANFNKNTARADGLDNLCRQCRHEVYERGKRTAKAAI